MEQLTDQEREALAELLEPRWQYLISKTQQQALSKVVQAKLLVFDQSAANLATATMVVVDTAKALDDIDAKLVVAWRELTQNQREQLKGTDVEARALNAVHSAISKSRGPAHPYDMGPGQNQDGSPTTIPECDCGRTNEPWHPKRGKCKQSLGGVKL